MELSKNMEKELYKNLGKIRKLEMAFEKYIEENKMEYIPFSRKYFAVHAFSDCFNDLEVVFRISKDMYNQVEYLIREMVNILSSFDEDDKVVSELYNKMDKISYNIDSLMYSYRAEFDKCVQLYNDTVVGVGNIWAAVGYAAAHDPEMAAIIAAQPEEDPEYIAEFYEGFLSSKD